MKKITSASSLLLFTTVALTAFLFVEAADKVSATPPDENYQAHTPGGPFRFYGGRIDEGKAAFEELGCVQCHSVVGMEVAAPKGKRRLDLKLGSESRFVKRYEDIVLAITNPRHVITERYWMILTPAERQGAIEPMMPDLTDHMTARQLVDLTTFLDSAYANGLPAYIQPKQ